MKIQNVFKNGKLYGRSAWQIFSSKLRSKNDITDILNYRYISTKLATSGQPTSEQLKLISQAGYRTVLNLAPPNASNALPNEEAIATKLGMNYISIPVAWDNPTIADFI